MRNLLRFVSAANQFLLFIAVLVALALLGWQLWLEVRPAPTIAAGVPVVSEPAMESVPDRSISFSREVEGSFIFNVRADGIIRQQSQGQLNQFYFSGDSRVQHLVNLFVIPPGEEGKLLYPTDVYIDKITHCEDREWREDPDGPAILMLIVESDTNSDGTLSSADGSDLYLADCNASNLRKLKGGVSGYRLVSSESVLLTVPSAGKERFVVYNFATESFTQLVVPDAR